MTERKHWTAAEVASLDTPTYQMVTMTVAVPPVLKLWAHEQVKLGNYSSASEVVRDALRQLQKQTPAVSETPGMSG